MTGKETLYIKDMKNKTSKVTIDGKTYNIDLQRAKKLGIISPHNEITDFEVGDLFRSENGKVRIIVVETSWNSNRYNIIGCGGFQHYSDFGEEGLSREDMLAYLNGEGDEDNTKYVFIANLNDEMGELIDRICDDYE